MEEKTRISRVVERAHVEENENWRDIMYKIPFIPFPPKWQIKPIPPFGGAVARFRVKLPNGKEKSVYLDWFDRLGCYGEPYWEVYPVDGDVGRCPVEDTESLIQLIKAKG
jgi:hypothetical protein